MVSNFVGKLKLVYILVKILDWIIKRKRVDLYEQFRLKLEFKLLNIFLHMRGLGTRFFFTAMDLWKTTWSKNHEHFTEPRNKCCDVARQYSKHLNGSEIHRENITVSAFLAIKIECGKTGICTEEFLKYVSSMGWESYNDIGPDC
jgi:hypothetical protein